MDEMSETGRIAHVREEFSNGLPIGIRGDPVHRLVEKHLLEDVKSLLQGEGSPTLFVEHAIDLLASGHETDITDHTPIDGGGRESLGLPPMGEVVEEAVRSHIAYLTRVSEHR